MRTLDIVLIFTPFLTLSAGKIFLVKVRVDPEHSRMSTPALYREVYHSMELVGEPDESYGSDYADMSYDDATTTVNELTEYKEADNSNANKEADNASTNKEAENINVNKAADNASTNKEAENINVNKEAYDTNTNKKADDTNTNREAENINANKEAYDTNANKEADDTNTIKEKPGQLSEIYQGLEIYETGADIDSIDYEDIEQILKEAEQVLLEGDNVKNQETDSETEDEQSGDNEMNQTQTPHKDTTAESIVTDTNKEKYKEEIPDYEKTFKGVDDPYAIDMGEY